MTNRKERLREITSRIEGILAPVTFMVPLQGSLAVTAISCAMDQGIRPEMLIAEAVRAYLGDDA